MGGKRQDEKAKRNAEEFQKEIIARLKDESKAAVTRFKDTYWKYRHEQKSKINVDQLADESMKSAQRLIESGMASYQDWGNAMMEIAQSALKLGDVLEAKYMGVIDALPNFAPTVKLFWGIMINPKNPDQAVTFDVQVNEKGKLKSEAFTDSFDFGAGSKVQQLFDVGVKSWLDENDYAVINKEDGQYVVHKQTREFMTPKKWEELNQDEDSSLQAFLECRYDRKMVASPRMGA